MESSEQLMRELAWVRQLARALLRDDAAADDVAQDAWLVANARRPDAERPLRPWLFRVVRNLAITRRRADARRGARELVHEGQEPSSPDALVARVEQQRALADEVLALAEPYRSTVLLHFFEGLSSAQIARRLDLPDGTVRRRLKTALDQLRTRLERRDRNWLAALAPLVGAPTKGFVMKKMIAAGVVLALVIGGAVVWNQHRASEPPVARPPLVQGRATTPVRAAATIPVWATQTGVAPHAIAGVVVAAGAPVANATVRLGLKVGEFMYPLVAEATTDAQGRFDFGDQPAARFEISTQAEGYQPATLAMSNADPDAHGERLVISLDACIARIAGTISDASGGAITRARLTVDGLAGASSDASGHYDLCLAPIAGVAPPQTRFTLAADGYGTQTGHLSFIDGSHQDFTMTPEAIVVGRVVTPDDRPVADARVVATPDRMELVHHLAPGWAATDADGRFRIAGLAAGKYQLAATADAGVSEVRTLAIARATATSEVTLVVTPRARVTGRVVSNGAPVEGASVAVDGARWVFSQPDGSFTLDGVPFGTSEVAVARGRDAPPAATATRIVVDRPLVEHVVVEIPANASVRGRVLRKGVPIAGANLTYTRPGTQAMAITDSAGTDAFEGVPDGDAQLLAWSTSAKAFAMPIQVHAVVGEVVAQDIELGFAGEVQGTVVDTHDAPVAAAYVRLVDNGDTCEAMTDARGAFTCGMLAGGEYQPLVAPSPSTGTILPLVDGKPIAVAADGVVTGVRLVVDNARLAIRGTIVDDTGAIVADAHVEAIGRGFPVNGELQSVLADASGNFQIADLAPGLYNLHAHAADGSEREIFDIAAGTTTARIVLARSGAIAGTFTGFLARPVIELRTTTPDLHLVSTAIVDGATFSQLGLPAGHYAITARAGEQTATAEVDVLPGQTARVELRP